jgi:hypothetical protein
MTISYFLINRTKKDIILSDQANMSHDLRIGIKKRGWSLDHHIDFFSEKEQNIRWLVEEEGYTIDYKSW